MLIRRNFILDLNLPWSQRSIVKAPLESENPHSRAMPCLSSCYFILVDTWLNCFHVLFHAFSAQNIKSRAKPMPFTPPCAESN